MSKLDPVVDAHWLRANRSEVIVADVRTRLDGSSGRDAYDEGHIPGARHVDLDRDLSGPPSEHGGRHPLPTPTDFAETLGRLGISGTVPVVAYDDAGGAFAARLWWMLDVLGHPAAVLDGGIDAWGSDLETHRVEWDPCIVEPRPWPESRIATTEQVDGAIGDDQVIVLDARSAERFGGQPHPLDPRPGHIPGALSAPFSANLDDHGRLRSADELADRYLPLIAEAATVVASCGSGVTACLDLLAMRRAGLRDAKLYVGSWSAWAADPTLPVETGP